MTEPLSPDPRLRAGVMLAAQDRDGALDLARRIETAGFDSLWVGDHVAFHVPVPDAITLLAFAAAATERVRLGTSVYLLPLRHPMLSAKTTATLDLLSAGRVALGVGVGGEFPPEFEASGVPVAERGSRTDEAIEVVRRLWREDAVVHRGRHFAFGPVSLAPKPVQPGGPPILVGGRKPPALRRAGRLGDGYISHLCSPERYAENLHAIRRHAREAGRKEAPFEAAAFLFAIFDESHEKALDRADRALSRIYAMPFRDAARSYCLLGRPAECLERMRAFAAAGCRSFLLSPLMDPREFVERAGAEILPELPGLAR